MKTLLIMKPFLGEYRRRLEEAAPDLEVVYCERRPPSDGELGRASYIWGNPGVERLGACARLEWLQLQTAGYDSYTAPGALPPGAALCSCSGAYGLAISEYLVSSTLCLMKKLHLYRDLQHERKWAAAGEVMTAAGSRVLVVGVGDIGGSYARKMSALGARVSGARRSAGEKPEWLEAVYSVDRLDGILPDFDVVALCLPSSAQTAGLFSRERIGRMKRGALLLNIGRGSAVDTEALCDALESGALGGAGLDVMEPEPLPPEHRLWGLPSALLTPHRAGGEEFGEIYHSIIGIWLDNLKRLRAGEPLKNRISPI
jgi:phosphoglycerate dehydrogenase-like enzyme